MWEQEILEIFKEHLHPPSPEAKVYTMRGLAKKVGVSIGALSEAISGKRVLSKASALRALANLDIPNFRRRRLKFLISGSPEISRKVLNSKELACFQDWVARAIYEFCGGEHGVEIQRLDFSGFGVDSERTRKNINLLKDLNLICEGPSGIFHRVHEQLGSEPDIPDEVVRAAHISDLELFRQSILERSIEKRFVNSIMFSCHQADIPKIKKDVVDFVGKLQSLYEHPGDGVCLVHQGVIDFSEALK